MDHMFYSDALPKSAESAALVRRVLDRLEGEVPDETLANARLLASELVANAVEHVPQEGEIGVRIDRRDHLLRVEISDPGPGFVPQARTSASPDDSGWGLHFTARLASRWAADRDGRARVWFELDFEA